MPCPLCSTMWLVLSGVRGLFSEVLLYWVSVLRPNSPKIYQYTAAPAYPVHTVTPTHYTMSAMSRSSQPILQFWGERARFTPGPSFKQVPLYGQVLHIYCPWHCPHVLAVDNPGVSYQESPCFYTFQGDCIPLTLRDKWKRKLMHNHREGTIEVSWKTKNIMQTGLCWCPPVISMLWRLIEVNVVFKDSQDHTPRMCHSFNYKNDTGLKPSLSSTMELR
jgi:hypothetical protein